MQFNQLVLIVSWIYFDNFNEHMIRQSPLTLHTSKVA